MEHDGADQCNDSEQDIANILQPTHRGNKLLEYLGRAAGAS